MKRLMIAALGAGLLAGAALAQEPKKVQTKPAAPPATKGAAPGTAPDTKGAAPTAPADVQKKASYCIGLDIGRRFKMQAVDIDPESVARGMRDGLAGKAELSDEQIQEVMNAFREQVMAQQAEQSKSLAEKNTKESAQFLAANKTKEGVKTTASGLQYKVLKAGEGKTPGANDTVKVHYRGTLIDGTEFDSSYKRGEPAEFPVTAVIKGWTEALQLMKVGSKWQLFIPSDLAYGPEGRPPVIGPNAALVFEVELLGVQ